MNSFGLRPDCRLESLHYNPDLRSVNDQSLAYYEYGIYLRIHSAGRVGFGIGGKIPKNFKKLRKIPKNSEKLQKT